MSNTVNEQTFYVGTYSPSGQDSIIIAALNRQDGSLRRAAANAEVENPSFVIVNQAHTRLYAVIETEGDSGPAGGRVAAFELDEAQRTLRLLNVQSTEGGSPCHLTLAVDEQALLVANYSAGVTVFPIEADGRIGARADVQRHSGRGPTDRQEKPHPHSVNVKDGYVYVPDLGIDQVVIYRLAGAPGQPSLERVGHADLQPGAGPRHLAFHPNAPYVYVINELNNTIVVYSRSLTDGLLTELQTVSALPDGYTGTSYCAEVQVHPSGSVLYGANRGHDSIAVFDIAADGRLTLKQHISTQGAFPRNFSLTPDAVYLLAANQNSDSIYSYHVKPDGTLEATGHTLSVSKPVCIKF